MELYDGSTMSSEMDMVMQPEASPRANQDPSAAIRKNERMLDEAAVRDFCARWDQVQTTFIDDPRHAVELAGAMVDAVVKRVGDRFSEELTNLEQQWSQGQNASTEELRQIFQRYRALFDRLLTF